LLLARTSLTLDPAWPWSLPGVGASALGGVAILLAGITIWTYLGVRGASWRRIGLVVVLRLLALGVALLVALRPSLAFEETEETKPSRLFFLLDYSESMKITDEFNNLSRWANARRILATPVLQNVLKKVSAAKVEIAYYQGADDLRPYEPESQPTGKVTDMGTWLHEFSQRHGREKNLRGLVLLSDGADNGTKFPTLAEAAQLRGVCPIFAFGLGRPTTNTKQNDIDLAAIRVEPDPIPVKGKIKAVGTINAAGFENSNVQVSLWLQEIGAPEPKLAASTKQVLTKTEGNEVALLCDAPEKPGEIKVTLKVQPLEGEVSVLNNEISTFATVTKEGVSVLWVEGRRPRWESVMGRRVLAGDRRFNVSPDDRLPEEKPGAAVGDGLGLDKHHYDVIVIGDISAARLAGGDPNVFRQIERLVSEKGTGLLMMGGYETPWARNNDWNRAATLPFRQLLPVEPADNDQIETGLQLKPTLEGERYLLRLHDDAARNAQIWTRLFDQFEGVTNLGRLRPGATLYAQGDPGNAPLLVGWERGAGRVLVFAADTTWLAWRRLPETVAAHARFWKQLMLYLAHQENLDGTVQIALEKRRIAADGGERLAFTLRARGKNGLDVKNPQFTVKVIGPNKDVTDVPVLPEGSAFRGYFLKANAPGVYRLEASVKGTDTAGNELPTAPSAAHFLAYTHDRETLRSAADYELLAKIAGASGGQFALADERKLAGLLEDLLNQRDTLSRPKVELWPDWRRSPASDSLDDQLAALWNSTALPSYLVFAGLLCCEWYLRRCWGLV
jgi:uncharacterized membrane protein